MIPEEDLTDVTLMSEDESCLLNALLCLSLEIHHLGMVQRRLKSEVWLRDVFEQANIGR